MHKLVCMALFMIAPICTIRGFSYPAQNSASPNSIPMGGKGCCELYSWQQQGKWNFVLISHTNRQKSVREIITGPDIVSKGWVKVRASNVDELKLMLGRLPKEASISWSGDIFRFAYPSSEGNPFEFPPQAIVNSIIIYSKQLSLRVSVTP